MKLTAQIKLLPTDEQHEKLLQTVERANGACQRGVRLDQRSGVG